MLETGDFGGDKLSGLEFAGFSGQKTDFGALQTPGASFRKRRRTRKTHFLEFAVFSASCSKNGAVTKR